MASPHPTSETQSVSAAAAAAAAADQPCTPGKSLSAHASESGDKDVYANDTVIEASSKEHSDSLDKDSHDHSPADDDDDDNSAREDDAHPETTRSRSQSRSRSESRESGEASPIAEPASTAPPLPNEAPPLPAEAPPPGEDDGWDFHWSEESQAYFFHNRFTGATTWENPRITGQAGPSSQVDSKANPASSAPPAPPQNERQPAGGYNPAIHGDYDPNAWYAQNYADPADSSQANPQAAAGEQNVTTGAFNRFTGGWQADDVNPDRHNDESKSRRQMNAYFDVDAAANSHDGRSLKAERSGKKPSKTELKAFKEKRKARKEEKRRAWLRD